MRKAFCLIRDHPVYRREGFVEGLVAAGFNVPRDGYSVEADSKPGDVLVIWNRYAQWHEIACRAEKRGVRVVVAENAYVGNDRSNRTRYALARDGHNGSGWWPRVDDSGARLQLLGLKFKPWREDGGHILVCPNRSFGRPDFPIMPPDWGVATANRLAKITSRPIRVRPHPGNDAPKIPLAHDLKDAWAVVIWTSSAGCEALMEGIPVFCVGPYWICRHAALDNLNLIETPLLSDEKREQEFRSLAWAQWHIEEIARGEPFQYLCNDAPAFEGRV